jgi:integrase
VKAKPKGSKYRNLYASGGAIYYQRTTDGKRVRVSCRTSDWSKAAEFRDEYDRQEGASDARATCALRARCRRSPTSPSGISKRTWRISRPRRGRCGAATCKQRGPSFGRWAHRLDAISLPMLREWWEEAVKARTLAPRTGRAYLDVLAAIYEYAKELELVEESPVPRFRETLRRRSRTKAGRTETDPRRPIESADELARLAAAAEAEGERYADTLEARAAEHEQRGRADLGQFQQTAAAHARAVGPMHAAFVLTLLDAGLRVGEALALTWGQVAWGADEADTTRALYIDRNRPQGGAPEPPKSGRSRTVALSHRLRRALRALYDARFHPGPEAAVFGGLDDRNFSKREWRRICEAAGLGHRALKDCATRSPRSCSRPG